MKEYLSSDKTHRGPLLSPAKAARLSEQGGEKNTFQEVVVPGVFGETLKQPHYHNCIDANIVDHTIVSGLPTKEISRQQGKSLR